VLSHLANTLACRFAQTDQRLDVEEAILLNRAALDLLASKDPRRPGALNALSTVLYKLFMASGQLATLDEAISLLRDSLSFPECDRSDTLNTLASYLKYRFRVSNKRTDLEEAISLNRSALHLLVPKDPRRSSTLNTLAIALFSLYSESNEPPVVDEAISLFRESLTLPV
jgi:tetratricopeptide (TPR) repeat protein